jgi:hypothetical protein
MGNITRKYEQKTLPQVVFEVYKPLLINISTLLHNRLKTKI